MESSGKFGSTLHDSGRREGTVDWEKLLLVYFHDPPDKALSVPGHEERAARYASVALGRRVSNSELRALTKSADVGAAIAERVPLPTAGPRGMRAVSVEEAKLQVSHPLSGVSEFVDCKPLDEDSVIRVITDIVEGLSSPRDRFMALWRLLPDSLPSWMKRLPADTRIPDHTLAHHADAAAGIWASGGQEGACLSVVISPVQRFIEAARSVRDLWTGSALLSWLAFKTMLPVIRSLGPTALVFPSLRGNPLMDLWLRKEGIRKIPKPNVSMRRSPSLPHRFVAMIPWAQDGHSDYGLADRCRLAFQDAWKHSSKSVHGILAKKFDPLNSDWDKDWEAQVTNFFEVTVSVVPLSELSDARMSQHLGGSSFADVWRDASQIRSLSEEIPARHRPGYAQTGAGRWQAQLEFSARLMEAQRQVRHVPPSTARASYYETIPAKCSLFGSWEQMGPAAFDLSREFWNNVVEALQRSSIDGVRLRERERFCAIALVKRFAGPVVLADELSLHASKLRFPDTATVAAAGWLSKASISPDSIREESGYWSGRWLHNTMELDEPNCPQTVQSKLRVAAKNFGPAPVYFAVLKMDGDDIGEWLRGDKSPSLRTVLHPKIAQYYGSLGIQEKLKARRPVGPALHASISGALGQFATQSVPNIVQNHHGTVIYCGGDDLLALLPCTQAVRCALALRQAYRDGNRHGDMLGMGSTATISAGISFVHHREDLRLAIQAARDAEKQAKDEGKDRVHLRFMRRSGGQDGATLDWKGSKWFCERVDDFYRGASSGWTYKLSDEFPSAIVEVLPKSALRSLIVRVGNRIEDPLWQELARPDSPGVLIARWWDSMVASGNDSLSHKDLLENFIRLCKGAAFVARSRDE